MPKVTVYSKEKCVQCVAVKRWLDKNAEKNEYEVKEAVDHMDYLLTLGVREMPIVVTENGNVFGGYQPDKLQQVFAGA